MRVYLDHHASAPLVPAAREAMTVALGSANPASIHREGRAARTVVEDARSAVARALEVEPRHVVFTSGGTESVNLGIHALASRATREARAPRILTTRYEHPAVTGALEGLAGAGFTIEHFHDEGALPTREALSRALESEAAFVVVQAANHETGCVMPAGELAALASRHQVPIFVDASQAVGRVDVPAGLAWLAMASSKVGGPSGAGALIVPGLEDVEPLVRGGGQERGRRGGTPDVVALAGFGAAMQRLPERRASMERVGSLRDRLEAALLARGARRNGLASERLASATNVAIPRWRGSTLVAALDVEGVACSSGAACSSGVDAPSPVLSAMHPGEPERATSALRLTLGPELDEDVIDRAIEVLVRVMSRR